MKHLILLAGGSCAGKTTLAKKAKFPKFYFTLILAVFGKFLLVGKRIWNKGCSRMTMWDPRSNKIEIGICYLRRNLHSGISLKL